MNIRELFSLTDTDHQGTLEGISAGVEFKGTNLWLLVMAMLIASLGLNVNSVAVIIGAMLVSPLMGPIAGAGLALAIYDLELLKKSLINLGIMTAIALGASFVYFSLSPLSTVTSELIARTSPTFFDVLIAFTGGAAMILAASRKQKGSNPLAGVAIATALMPPLCTAGYGLAMGNMAYFFGAMYLYGINSVFIGLATFLFTRFMGLVPLVEGGDGALIPKNIKRQHLWISLGAIIVFVVPSLFIGWDMVAETTYQARVKEFVASTMKFPASRVAAVDASRKTTPNKIEVTLMGQVVSQETIDHLKTLLPDYDLAGSELLVIQSGQDITLPGRETISGVDIDQTQERTQAQDQTVNTTMEVPQTFDRMLVLNQVEQEVKLAFPSLEGLVWGDLVVPVDKDFETEKAYTCFVLWRPGTTDVEKTRFLAFMRVRLGLSSLGVLDLRS